MNSFCHYLDRLPTLALRAHLALLCSQPLYPRGFPSPVMEELEKLGLVRRHREGWRPTWLGYGVNNWHRQLEASLHLEHDHPVPEPRAGENGQELGPACDDYRELTFRTGFCWCARPAGLHPGRLPQLAEKILHWHNQNLGRKGPDSSGSGRSLIGLLAQLTSVERAVLQQAWEHPAGVQLAELAGHFACLVHFSVLKTAVYQLMQLGLLSHPELALTWDGRGSVRFMAELQLARQRSKPLDEPRTGENGVDPLHSPCLQFRPLLGQPELCWCGWHQAGHDRREKTGKDELEC